MANRNLYIAGLLCFIFFLVFYGVTSRANLQVSDEAAVFSTGISLALHGNPAIDELQWLQKGVNIGQIGRGNHLYAKYFPGIELGIAVVYKLAEKTNDQPFIWNTHEMAPSITGAIWAMKINALFGALAMTALLALLKRYFDWKTTVVTVILAGLCSDWWYQSRGLLSEVGAGSLLMASLCLVAYKKPYSSGVFFALSILFRPTNLVALPIWGLAIWHNGKKAIWSGLAIVTSIFILALYNWFRFGSLFDFGYGTEKFGSSLLAGLYGILLSPGRSLFIYSPILTLAIPGAWLFYKKEKV